MDFRILKVQFPFYLRIDFFFQLNNKNKSHKFRENKDLVVIV